MRFPRALLAAAVALLAAAPGAAAALPQQSGGVDLLTQAFAQWDGPRAGAHAGSGLAGVGDFNGDGAGDYAIGVPDAQAGAEGSVYVLFGPVGPGALDLQAFGARGVRIDGDAPGRRVGATVDAAGDVNGDGLGDVAFTAASAADRDAWVVFGRRTAGVVDVGSLGSGGYRVDCGGCGFAAVAGTGDVNGDSLDDLALGDPVSGRQRIHVVHGKAGGGAIDAVTAPGYKVLATAVNAPTDAGGTVAGIGDVNGDGRGDLVFGDPGVDHPARPDAGSAYVVFGRPGSADVDVDTLGTGGYEVIGERASDRVGRSVGGGDDVNGDGRPDVVVGAPLAEREGVAGAGAAYVVFGKANSLDLELGGLGTGGFRIEGAPGPHRVGRAAAILGDVTGDGLADVGVAAPGAGYNGRPLSGSVHVVRGRAGPDVDLDAQPATYGYRVDGASGDDRLGDELPLTANADAVAGGDVNGDGRPDLLVASARAGNNARPESGSAYAVLGFGSPALAYDPLLARVGAGVAHGPRGVRRTGPASFRIDPALPGGLSLDPSTGVIRGAPASPWFRTHTVTMTDLSGSARVPVLVDVSGSSSGGPPPVTRSPACVNRIRGTNRRDVLNGTPFGDDLIGRRGNDRLIANAGNDCLRGGKGRDRLSAGPGRDRLRGESGSDTLTGGSGNDSISGGPGRDRANGGLGKDTYSMGPGNDRLTTADGVAERVNCGKGRDRVVIADRGDRLRNCERVSRN